MIYTIAKQKKYVPEWNGNRELKKEDQFYVMIGFPSVSEAAEFSTETENSNIFSFMLYVKEIHNLKIEVDGDVRDATVRDLIEVPGLVDLFNEINREYRKLTTIDKKK